MGESRRSRYRLRSTATLELFTRVFSATAADARGTEQERLQLVPLVFGLLPAAAFTRRHSDERIKPAIRTHLSSLRIEPSEPLVDTLKEIADQYYSATLKPPSERPRKLGIESVRALRTNIYVRLRGRQCGRCAVCGVRLGKDTGETLDHIIPWALMGDRFDGSNWQLLCGACNMGKREWLSALQSPQAANWHYGASDTLPVVEPTLEARYLALALAGSCEARDCSKGPRDARLTVVRRFASGLAVVDNLVVFCEEHAAVADARKSEPPSPASERPVAPPSTVEAVVPRTAPAPQELPELLGTFAGYALIRRVSGGGMAESFLAIDEETGQEVFLKRAHADTADALAMAREAEIYQKLERRYAEHVPRVVDIGRHGGYSFLITERAETDLEQHVLSRGRVGTTEAKGILRQIVEGLEELHGMEIVHRDLKPSNVLRLGERWLLADFGISKDRRASLGAGTFQLRGTTGYAAPEQILTGVEAHVSADIFALGKIMVFLLTGGTDIDRVVFREWRGVARRCTADDPEARPTLELVKSELEAITE